MSVTAGPTVNTNGLVFYYDNGNAEKSFIGPPTTNLVTTQVYTQSWNNSGTATWSTNDTTVPRLFSNIPVSSMTKDTFGNSHIGIGEATISTNTTYAVSIYCYIPENSIILDGTAPYMRAFPTNASRGYLTYNGTELWNTWPRNTWIRANGTFASGTDTSCYISCYLNSATNKIAFTAAQVEAQTFATKFVNGSRSNTQSVVDLSNNNIITATSLTYLSSGTFSFNGSSDFLRPNITHSYLSSSCLEVWFNSTSHGSVRKTIFGYAHNEGYSNPTIGTIFLDGNNLYASVITASQTYRTVMASSAISTSTWYCAALNKNTVTGNLDLYLNGALSGTQTFDPVSYGQWTTTGTFIGSNILDIGKSTNNSVGQGWSTSYFSGSIPIAKVYNRVLTAAEIAQNFNATRSRFGL